MRIGSAILTTLLILVVWTIAVVTLNPAVGWAILLGTVIWVGVDSLRILLENKKGAGPAGIIAALIECFFLALGCLLLWIVVFPWYLVNRTSFRLKGTSTTDTTLEEAAKNQSVGGPSPSRQPRNDMIDQLERLAALRDKGVLSDDEFKQQKEKIL